MLLQGLPNRQQRNADVWLYQCAMLLQGLPNRQHEDTEHDDDDGSSLGSTLATDLDGMAIALARCWIVCVCVGVCMYLWVGGCTMFLCLVCMWVYACVGVVSMYLRAFCKRCFCCERHSTLVAETQMVFFTHVKVCPAMDFDVE
jgi:Flp pilus assembly protein TadB